MTHAVELSSSESAHILESARQAGRPVRVHPKSWPESRWISGHLVNEPARTLEVDAPDDAATNPSHSLTCYCQVDLELGEGQYFFDSHIISVRPGNKVLRLSLGWPKTILVLQRRGSGRACLAQASAVHLSREENGRLSSFEGRLYNLSRSGLAFKIPMECAHHIEIGQSWSVCFEVPEQHHTYRLEGTVRRQLPSSSETDAIVGLHFDDTANNTAELDQLREFLTHRGRAGAAIGGTP